LYYVFCSRCFVYSEAKDKNQAEIGAVKKVCNLDGRLPGCNLPLLLPGQPRHVNASLSTNPAEEQTSTMLTYLNHPVFQPE